MIHHLSLLFFLHHHIRFPSTACLSTFNEFADDEGKKLEKVIDGRMTSLRST